MGCDKSSPQKSAPGAGTTRRSEVRDSICPSSYPSSQPPTEAVPTESLSHGHAEGPIRQAIHETSDGGACSSRCFAVQRGSNCPKRERPRDAGSDGTRLAPRRQRALKLSGVWVPHPSPHRLLSAVRKQQVCCRLGACSPTGKMGQAELARRQSQSKRLYGSGLRRDFRAEILNFRR